MNLLFDTLKSNGLWKIALIGVCIFAGLMFIVGYDIGYIPTEALYTDGIYIHQQAYNMLHNSDTPAIFLGYPPVILWMNMLAHQVVVQQTGDPVSTHTIEAINILRLWNGFFNVGTAMMLAIIGRRLINVWAGLLAAGLWISSLFLLPFIKTELTEAGQSFFIACTIYFAVRGLQTETPRFFIFATLCGLMAVLFKYSAFPILGMGVGGAFWLLLWQTDKIRWVKNLAIQIALILIAAITILILYGAKEIFFTGREGTVALSGGQFLNWEYFVQIWNISIRQSLARLPGIVYLALLIAGFALSWRKEHPRHGVIWLYLLIIFFFQLYLTLRYTVYEVLLPRYIAPNTLLLILLTALGAVYILQFIAGFIPNRRYRQFVTIIIGGWLAWSWVIYPYSQLVFDNTKPRVETVYARWTEVALPQGTIRLPSNYTYIYFDVSLGGYLQSSRPFVTNRLHEKTISEWTDIYVQYATLAAYERDHLLALPDSSEWTDHLYLLKTFPADAQYPDAGYSGETLYTYALRAPEQELDAIFGNQIHLRGMTTVQDTDNQTIIITPYWQAIAPVETDYQVYLHLVAEGERDVLAQADLTMSRPTYPPTMWNDPDEIIIGNSGTITLPPDLPQGSYQILLGLYRLDDFSRLTLADGADHIVVETIEQN